MNHSLLRTLLFVMIVFSVGYSAFALYNYDSKAKSPLLFNISKQKSRKQAQLANEVVKSISEIDPFQDANPDMPPIQYILQDKEDLISNTFKVPEGLEKHVEFWFKIYSLYSSRQIVIHDSDYLLTYAVIDTRPIFNRPISYMKASILKNLEVKKAKHKYRTIVSKLAEPHLNFNTLTAEEKRIYDLFKDIDMPRIKKFKTARDNLRDQPGQKDFMIEGIKHSGRYLRQMEQIFAHKNLPPELTRLPLVESSFNYKAMSKVGASGIWQFMRQTGKSTDLTIQTHIDERNSPLKATSAAAKLMESNYKILKDWYLAVMAYNHGAGGIYKATQVLNSKNPALIIENYHSRSFQFASRNFLCEFLAALYTEKYQEKIFGYLNKMDELEHEDIEMKYSMRAMILIEITDLSKEELRLYNPDLRNKIINSQTYFPVGYYLKLPLGKKQLLEKFYEEAEYAKSLYGQ